jgi:hypothetical protein
MSIEKQAIQPKFTASSDIRIVDTRALPYFEQIDEVNLDLFPWAKDDEQPVVLQILQQRIESLVDDRRHLVGFRVLGKDVRD